MVVLMWSSSPRISIRRLSTSCCLSMAASCSSARLQTLLISFCISVSVAIGLLLVCLDHGGAIAPRAFLVVWIGRGGFHCREGIEVGVVPDVTGDALQPARVVGGALVQSPLV